MLNPGGSGGFVPYGQTANAGYQIGGLGGVLPGGMQGGMPGARAGLAGLQAAAGVQQQQQGPVGRFTGALQSQLQQLNQLNQFSSQAHQQQQQQQAAQAQAQQQQAAAVAAQQQQQQQQRSLGGQMSSGMQMSGAPGGVGQQQQQQQQRGGGGLGAFTAIRPVERQGYPAMLNAQQRVNVMAQPGLGGQPGIAGLAGLQLNNVQQQQQGGGGTASGTLQQQGGGARLPFQQQQQPQLGGTNQQLQQAVGGTAAAGLNMLQQSGLAGQGAGGGHNPSQELLAMISKRPQMAPLGVPPTQQQQQQAGGGAQGSFVQVLPTSLAGMSALQQQQQQQQQQLQQQVGAPQQPQQQHLEQDGAGIPSFDNSEFPSLASVPRQQQQQHGGGAAAALGQLAGSMDGFSHVGVRKAAQVAAGGPAGHAGFSMQVEDFPALSGGLANGQQQQQQQQGSSAVGGTARLHPGGGGAFGQSGDQVAELAGQRAGPGGTDYEAAMSMQQQQGGWPGGTPQLLKGEGGAGGVGAKQRHVPQQPPDRFGLLGLLSVIKMTDQDLTMLALGTDLTGLGLNLNCTDTLHKALVSPLSDTPTKVEPEYELPSCYKHTPQRLQPGYLQKFKEETLFYMFYSMPQDEAQIIAADELYTRGWWFHKRYKVWMIHAPVPQTIKSARGERGTYLVFDINIWEVVQKPDLEIEYADIEQPPRLPRAKHLQQQQQQQGGGIMQQQQQQQPRHA